MISSTDKNERGPIIVWFRRDLRLADHPALSAASASGQPVIGVFILEENKTGPRPYGGAQRWWLHHSLERLAKRLDEDGGQLVLRRGSAEAVLPEIARQTSAEAVYFIERYEKDGRLADEKVDNALAATSIRTHDFEGNYLHDPQRTRTKTGGHFKVYSPFWRAVSAIDIEPPLPAPEHVRWYAKSIASDCLEDWHLLPSGPDWSAGFSDVWQPGETGASLRLEELLDGSLAGYAEARDIPGVEGTGRLSPHLALGEISPRQIWHALRQGAQGPSDRDIMVYRKELVWREFCLHLLHHHPDLATTNYDRRFDAFPWREAGDDLVRWQRGETGYPIVDAGMRQLWHTGWMHNRVRMVCASFLIKHLMIDWRHGEKWFWDTLVDADAASNAANWQWVAGSGADAAPYFRIFNPILQGLKFDTDGAYVRRHVTALDAMPATHIHAPWEAPDVKLQSAGIRLGKDYPLPIVDHPSARRRALAAFEAIKQHA